MNTQVNSDNPTLSLGVQFRQAREALNLSLEDVSKTIQLRPSILEQIENDEWVQSHIAPIFMRGYVQSYARFLKLPNEMWQSFNFGATQKNDLNRNAGAKIEDNPYSTYGRWIGYFTVLVLFIVAGMTGLWWWQNYQQSNAERDTLVQNYQATENAPQAHSVVQTEAVVEKQTEVITEEVKPEVEIKPIEVPLQAETSSIQLTSVVTQDVIATTGENPKSVVENQPVSEVKGDLQIEIIAASSWITVKDAKRKNLAQQEYKEGDILTFDAQGPYSLTIGAPANVKITYKGEAYPLTIDGRVARIKLQ